MDNTVQLFNSLTGFSVTVNVRVEDSTETRSVLKLATLCDSVDDAPVAVLCAAGSLALFPSLSRLVSFNTETTKVSKRLDFCVPNLLTPRLLDA